MCGETRLWTRVQPRGAGRQISAVMQQQLLVASEIHLIFQTFPRQSSSLSLPHSYFCTLSLDNSFQMGRQRGRNRLHPRCFFRLSPHTHTHTLFCFFLPPHHPTQTSLICLPFSGSSSLSLHPCSPLLPPHLPSCPNKCLIFPMMI